MGKRQVMVVGLNPGLVTGCRGGRKKTCGEHRTEKERSRFLGVKRKTLESIVELQEV